MKQQFEIHVTGRVQGVGFRGAARGQARSLRLKGWVENMPDGSVRIQIFGEAADCHQFISWCHQGSGYSWVEKVSFHEMEPGALESFRIRH